MTKAQKKKTMKVILFALIAFILLVIFLPMFNVEAVELGAEPTFWQNIHEWFTKVKDFFVETWGLLLLVGGIGFGGYYLIKKK